MTSIITGSDGFIAKKLIEKLSLSKVDLLTLTRKDGDLSITPLHDLIKEKAKIDQLFHLAARTFVPHAWEEPEEFINENISCTLNILNYCRLKEIPLIYISAYIYGEQLELPIKENAVIKPSNPYAQSKYLCEQICKYYVEVFSLDITILRPFNVYGLGQNKNFLIPEIIEQIKNNEKVVVNSFNPRRDYIHVEDLVEAVIASTKIMNGLQVYNIGSGYSVSVKDIIKLIEEIIRKSLQSEERNIVRNNELMNVVADISKASASLNWKPKLTLREGLTQILFQEGLCTED
jgi:nucleoside-diphosphate-sugar epimerase|tara:strand:- start:633 stop:1502 length:870 start_codon:yes stop_codon:yes gene_type:complete